MWVVLMASRLEVLVWQLHMIVTFFLVNISRLACMFCLHSCLRYFLAVYGLCLSSWLLLLIIYSKHKIISHYILIWSGCDENVTRLQRRARSFQSCYILDDRTIPQTILEPIIIRPPLCDEIPKYRRLFLFGCITLLFGIDMSLILFKGTLSTAEALKYKSPICRVHLMFFFVSASPFPST